MTVPLILAAVPVLGWTLVVHMLTWALVILATAFLVCLGKLLAEDFHRWLVLRCRDSA
jgi:hypothetical protein